MLMWRLKDAIVLHRTYIRYSCVLTAYFFVQSNFLFLWVKIYDIHVISSISIVDSILKLCINPSRRWPSDVFLHNDKEICFFFDSKRLGTWFFVSWEREKNISNIRLSTKKYIWITKRINRNEQIFSLFMLVPSNKHYHDKQSFELDWNNNKPTDFDVSVLKTVI